MATAGVLTVSDRCSAGAAVDSSGPALVTILNTKVGIADVVCECVPDNIEAIQAVLLRWADELKLSLILTTGGTGFSPRDQTPEATQPLLDKPAPGIVVAMVTKSLASTPMAMLSRPAAGIRGTCLIVNLPGSRKGSSECLEIICPALSHAIALLIDDKVAVEAVHTPSEHTHPAPPDHTHTASAPPEHTHTASAPPDHTHPGSAPRHSPYPMVPVQEAFSIVLRCAHKLTMVSTQLSGALGKVLGEAVYATRPHPPFPASMKDGYAVVSSDQSHDRRVLFATTAGKLPKGELSPGYVSKITTGAALPAGSDAVVQVEDTQLVATGANGQEEVVRILASVTPGVDVRSEGVDVKAGELVLEAGVLIRPPEIGLLASLGLTQVSVVTSPTVAVLSTGDEVVEAGEKLSGGCVYDSNRPSLLAAVAQVGGRGIDLGIAPDNRSALVGKLKQALSLADIVVSSGGVSMGELDLLKPVLKEEFGAEVHFGRVLMKPGKPTTLATVVWDGVTKMVFALPGNPVSCLVSFSVFVVPAMLKMAGRSQHSLKKIKVELGECMRLDPVRPEYHRAQLDWSSATPVAISTGSQRSSRLTSLRAADVLLELPQASTGCTEMPQGSIVTGLLLPA